MELRHLRYFIAVGKLLSFSRAAVQLHIAQPSLSVQLRDLEDELGFRLLDRDRTHVALTEAGAVFLREAQQVLAIAETAIQRGREAAAGQAGGLHTQRLPEIALPSLTLTTAKRIKRAAAPETRMVMRASVGRPAKLAPPRAL
jgi:DNA-binding transcriptional LysR family regulator